MISLWVFMMDNLQRMVQLQLYDVMEAKLGVTAIIYCDTLSKYIFMTSVMC